ncbi:Aste57867_20108 [Aphanomyces stellatus]|uniref:Aste57867_20108 protein n=1 Tax=Aphanomyces stellatus TaxID=120398 RepID=A0A485LE75_9STRA|nr:hypothetical protein As57867_020042 [Aphanomyces stellatus]VFT96803.1 Aste57867_20108 [Aphanomyces stellatus]
MPALPCTSLCFLAALGVAASSAFDITNQSMGLDWQSSNATVGVVDLHGATWKLSFEDHFDRLDRAVWRVTDDCSTQGGCIHNDEKQVYLKDQVFVQDGHLVVEAVDRAHASPNAGSRQYRSGKLDTSTSFNQQFGIFEARIQLPQGGPGIWPAFWLMPHGGRCWPMDGEIDIMEYVGKTPDDVYGNYHFGGGCNANRHYDSNVCGPTGASYGLPLRQGGFHTYKVVWTPGAIHWFVDDHEFYSLPPRGCRNPALFFLPTKPFYLILNLAVGGSWPGDPTSATSFPQRMLVDYVKVYSYLGGSIDTTIMRHSTSSPGTTRAAASPATINTTNI